MEGAAPQRTLASMMKNHQVRKPIHKVFSEAGESRAIAEEQGHLLLRPAIVKGLVARDAPRKSTNIIKVDRTRHKFACHGGRDDT